MFIFYLKKKKIYTWIWAFQSHFYSLNPPKSTKLVCHRCWVRNCMFEDVCSCPNKLQNQCQHQARQWVLYFQERRLILFFLEIKISQTNEMMGNKFFRILLIPTILSLTWLLWLPILKFFLKKDFACIHCLHFLSWPFGVILRLIWKAY